MNDPIRDLQAKKEDDPNHSSKFPKIPNSSRHWSSHKNPRIVRVSRSFGGKDRHSKVCTVRGLRDRRIRLSVQTAIQLYDLQDRLGLSQPSKVVDWLLDATKDDIDKLPPLPMLPLHLQPTHESPQFLASHYAKEEIKTDELIMAKDTSTNVLHEGFGGFVAQISAQNLFPLNNTDSNQSSNFTNFSYNNPYAFHWDPPGLSLSQSGGFAFPDDRTGLSLQSTSSDLYFCPSVVPSLIPSFVPSMESEFRQSFNNHIQQNNNPAVLLPTTLNLISPPMIKTSPFPHSTRSVYSQESDHRRVLKDK